MVINNPYLKRLRLAYINFFVLKQRLAKWPIKWDHVRINYLEGRIVNKDLKISTVEKSKHGALSDYSEGILFIYLFGESYEEEEFLGFDVRNLDPDSDLEGFESGNDESDIQMTDEENESGGEGEAAIAAQKWTTTFSPI